MSAIRSFFRRNVTPRNVVVFSAISLIPLIYAGLLTSSNIDPTHRLNAVPAAIVNEDAGAAAPAGDPLALGDDLVDELTSNTEDNNFDWTVTSAQEAAHRLDDGEAYAVLTIPADFSANVASLGGDDVSKAAQSELRIQTNDADNMIVGNIASTIGSAVTDTVRDQVSAEYLDQIYLGFSDVHSSLSDAADGAGELSDGAATAADGSDDLVVGLSQLQDGTVQLADGALTLADGTTTARSGAAELQSGLATLRSATKALPEQAKQLDDGAQQIASGSSALSGGIGDLADGAADLQSGSSELAKGAKAAHSGASDLADGASDLSDGIDQAVTGVEQLLDNVRGLADGAPALADNVQKVNADLQHLITDSSTMTDEERQAALEQLQTDYDAVQQQASGLVEAGADLRDDAEQMLSDAPATLNTMVDGVHALRDGAAALRDGTGELDTGAAALAKGAKTLSTGAATAAEKSGELAAGASTLAEGTSTLSKQATPLAGGIAQAADGATSLASGLGALDDGAHTLASGASDAATGTSQAASGAGDLNDGLHELSDGSKTLHEGLVDGVDQVPNYSDDEADELSSVAASPVKLTTERVNAVDGYGAGLAPYFLSLALWVGAMSFYLMAQSLNRRALAARMPAWRLMLRSLVPGAVMGVLQGLFAACVLHFWVGVSMSAFPAVLGIAMLASVTFMAVNQALIALLDSPGRFIALMLVVLQLASAGGTYPVETAPAFFQWAHNLLPITHTVEAFRTLIAGGNTAAVGSAIGVLLIWLGSALVLSFVASVLHLRKARKAEAVSSLAATPAEAMAVA